MEMKVEGGNEGRKVIPPPPPQTGVRGFIDRGVGGVMQVLGLI